MKTRVALAAALMALCAATGLRAQDFVEQEIVVTAQRAMTEQELYDDSSLDERPAVGLRRKADFLVQQVAIRGDTRDEAQRRQEIRAMLENAVRLAARHGVELAYGDYVLTALTPANLDDIVIARDNRPDSERISFLIKASLAGERTGAQAQEAIAAFVAAVPEVGRAQMDLSGEPSLSLVGPDSYRPQVLAEITRDAQALTALMGDGYAVEIEGLNKPVQWARSGLAEVLLYIPYRLTLQPRP